jgi:hypothetical protein
MTSKEFRRSLEQKTYSDVEALGQRVFYTLTDVSEGKSISVADASQPTKLHYAAHRQAMFLSMLCEKLEAKGILSRNEIQDILFDTVSGPGSAEAAAG